MQVSLSFLLFYASPPPLKISVLASFANRPEDHQRHQSAPTTAFPSRLLYLSSIHLIAMQKQSSLLFGLVRSSSTSSDGRNCTEMAPLKQQSTAPIIIVILDTALAFNMAIFASCQAAKK